MNGFIKLHRQITDWGWYQDNNTKAVFLHLLLTANWHDSDFEGQPIKRGQAVYGLLSLADKLNLSVRQVRTAISHLKSTNEITVQSTHKFSIATIVKYGFYQDEQATGDKQKSVMDDNEVTTRRQSSDNETSTSKNRRSKEVYMYQQPRQAAWSGSRYGRDQEYVAEWDVPLWNGRGRKTETE